MVKNKDKDNIPVKLKQVFQQWGGLAERAEWAGLRVQVGQILASLRQQGKVAQLGAPDLLLQAAQSLSAAHPHSALLLAQEVLQPQGGAWAEALTVTRLSAAWKLIAAMQDRLGHWKEAKAATLKVLDLADAPPEDVIQVANLLVRYGDHEQAFTAALAAYQTLGSPLRHASSLLYIAQRVAHWPTVAMLTAQLRAAYGEGRFDEAAESPRTHLLWCDDEATNIAVTARWSRQNMPRVAESRPPVAPLAGRRLRVGYLSSDFRDHPTARLINGLFRHHDRNRFELFMYCSGWDDGSALRREVESHMDQVHSVSKLSDKAAADLIRSHQIDVLVELNGPTRANRMGVLAHRPAPVQIDYLGWPGSVGGRVVDYVVGDFHTVPPGAEKRYPEKVIRLSGTYQVNDHRSFTRQPVPSRRSVGLPDDPDLVVLGMFNAINKVHGATWALWMRILKAVPKAVLWILNPGEQARKHISEACREHGVSIKRVLAAPSLKQEPHLARLQCCDLMLDPWPYGGHTSTTDALFAGVPVLTLEGHNFAGRVSGGLLHAAGLGALVQPDEEAYASTAIRLLRDPAELRRIKSFILRSIDRSLTLDAARRTRELESAYRQAARWAAAGEPFRHIAIGKPPAEAATAPAPVAAEPVPAAAVKLPLVLVCGPWSSGTSAMAGFLAKAGLPAPGPYVAVNDPRTPLTFEMLAFRDLLRGLASEQTLQRTRGSAEIVQALQAFADGPLRQARLAAGVPAEQPVLLKHALPALLLPELAQVFDLKVIGVLRPLEQIEATRQRRRWGSSFGRAGAQVVYQALFKQLIEGSFPFRLVRYGDLQVNPARVLEELAGFCGLSLTPETRAAALSHVDRSQRSAATDVEIAR